MLPKDPWDPESMSRHLHLLLLALLFEVSRVFTGSHFLLSSQEGSLINNKLNKYIQYIIRDTGGAARGLIALI